MTKPSIKFLLVDDDYDDASIFCEAMSHFDPSAICETVENGEEVFEVLSQPETDQPDVIFLDINMPIMDGWQCLKKLKEDPAYRDIPVIMYSTSSAKQDIDMAYSLGALTFLTKPEDFKELTEILHIVAKTPHQSLLQKLSVFESIKVSGRFN